MASEHDRDKWLERLLRRRSAAIPAGATPGVCLEPEAIAAWVDGALKAKEMAAAELHLSNCPRCTALLAAIERTGPAASTAAPARGMLFRWLVPLAAAATAVAIWVAIPEQQVIPVPGDAARSTESAAPPAAPPPSEAPRSPAAQPQAERAREDARPGDFRLADRSREEAKEARQERALEAEPDAAAEMQAAPARAPSAAPVPQRSADALNEAPSVAAQGAALGKVSVSESIAANPLVRWRVVSGTQVERSADGGKTWVSAWPQRETARSSFATIAIVAIRAVDALSATVTTSDGRTLSTTDGGATWAPSQEKPAAPF